MTSFDDAGDGGYGIEILDISTPSSPRHAGGFNSTAWGQGPSDIIVVGKYAYACYPDNMAVQVLELPGIDAPAASIGDIAATSIQVGEDVIVGDDVNVRGGLNVGRGGIKSDGPVSARGLGGGINSTALDVLNTSNIRVMQVWDNGNVSIGKVGVPTAKLEINGTLKAKMATNTGGNNAQWGVCWR